MAKKLIWSGVILTLLFCTGFAFAQGSSESSVKGNLGGVVTDSSGAVLPEAKITINGSTGSRSTVSGQDGRFLFQILTPGFYTAKVEKQGFKTSDIGAVEVLIGKTTTIPVKLDVGSGEVTIDVTTSAISVDTTSTAVGANLSDTFYQSIPVSRGVAGLFYAAPGVVDGGAGGSANPSISGGSGLENIYVADGVSITDGAFGGLGTYSRRYGSLSTGINLSFVQEVQVKTGGYEAQYGKSTGGIVQIVTKSGGNTYHGSIGGYFAPGSFERERLHADDSNLFNLFGKRQHVANFDLDGEISGYIPHFKNHLFFFGDFNPTSNRNYDQFAQFTSPGDRGTGGAGSTAAQFLGNVQRNEFIYNYAVKLTAKLNDQHQFEASLFADPTRSNSRPSTLVTSNGTTGDKLKYGTRNLVARYNGTWSPTWLFNTSWTWGHNAISDIPDFPNVFAITDLTQSRTCAQLALTTLQQCPGGSAQNFPFRGAYRRQGYGLVENTVSNTYGFSADTSKIFHFLGEHNATIGYKLDLGNYNGTRNRTGVRYVVPNCNASGRCGSQVYGSVALANSVVGATSDATFQLREAGASCTRCPLLFIPNHPGGIPVFLNQNRGEYGNPTFKTNSPYMTAFAQDTWSLNKYVTINAGLRWDQQELNGNNSHYVLTDNWSPRVGISVDPFGTRKTKLFANFGHYTEAIPLDIAIRSLSAELDFLSVRFAPVSTGTCGAVATPGCAGNVVVGADGSLPAPILDSAHLLTKAAGGQNRFPSISSQSSITAFAPGTKSQYLDEYVVGLEHEFKNTGIIFSARYTDRRLKRIVEDIAALTPECGELGCESQLYVIANPNAKSDIFINPSQLAYNSAGGTPAACLPDPDNNFGPTAIGTNGLANGSPTDSNGNNVTFAGNDSFCLTNAAVAGNLGSDGIADGFVDPVRRYKSVEFELNKSFSRNWQMRINYRIASLFGNYEGSLRNDNGQTDPNISSLFDFTQGNFNLLGDQFKSGPLNTDVRHLANGYVSYVFDKYHVKGLTIGTAVHFQTGVPINDLLAHPVYLNAGEIPVNGRGSLGRISPYGQVDLHLDYPVRLTENSRMHFGIDMFNLVNKRNLLNVDQNEQVTAGVPDADFRKPAGDGAAVPNAYQRPFYARFSLKWEF